MEPNDTRHWPCQYPVDYDPVIAGQIRETFDQLTAAVRRLRESSITCPKAPKEEGTRLYMINHALVSYALRLRGAGAKETELFRNFQFRLASA